jgi:hypothetical protein
MSEHLDGGLGASYQLSVPSAGPADLAAARVQRLGGPNASDLTYRQALYTAIGGIAVAGGHAESAMKRMVMVTRDSADSAASSLTAVSRMTWSGLEKELTAYAADDNCRVIGLAQTMKWAADNKIRDRRNNVIHGSWWDFDGVGVRFSRFFLDGSSSTIVGKFDYLTETYDLLVRFADALDDAVERRWPQIRLPKAEAPT